MAAFLQGEGGKDGIDAVVICSAETLLQAEAQGIAVVSLPQYLGPANHLSLLPGRAPGELACFPLAIGAVQPNLRLGKAGQGIDCRIQSVRDDDAGINGIGAIRSFVEAALITAGKLSGVIGKRHLDFIGCIPRCTYRHHI